VTIAISRLLTATCATAALVASGALVGSSPASAVSPVVAPFAASGSLPASPSVSASASDAQPTMSGWLPYWSLGSATSNALANADLFSDVSPFWFDAKADGSTSSTVRIEETWISSGSRSSVTQSLKGAGLKVLPSITDSTGTRYLAGVLAAPSKRTALVRQISKLVESGGYDGIDLDFETFAFSDGQASWAGTKPSWVAFITELSVALRANGKLLAVSVPPMYSDTTGYWVYAFRQIGPHIDKLRIMAYDYSWSTAGSIGGPLSWVRGLLGYAVDAVDRNKVFLGTPTYGRDWVTSAVGVGCPTTSGERAKLTRVMNTNSVTFTDQWVRDSASQERNRRYTESYNKGKCTLTRNAWLPDAETTLARWQVAKDYRIAGMAQWMIGTEQVGQWDLLRSRGAGKAPNVTVPPPAPVAPGGSVPRPVSLKATKIRKGKVVVQGRASGPKGEAVTIYRKMQADRRKLMSVTLGADGRFRAVIRSNSPTLRLRAKTSTGSSALLIVRR
jgi:spore germination protein YaaH